MTRHDVMLGVTTRTGSAVVVALVGSASMPRFAGRWDGALVPATLPVQPYHAAVGLEQAAAEQLVTRVEEAAEDTAAGILDGAAREVIDSAVSSVAVVVKPVSVSSEVMRILRSHAAMHAAEGVLYREAMLAATRRCGWAAHAVDESALPAAENVVRDLGRAAGRPWRRIEKDAARAALTLLPAS